MSAKVAAATAWRSHRIDPTGFYWLGARYYEPTSGRFLSADPMGHAASPSLYDFCSGDPLNRWDPDGRFWSEWGSTIWQTGASGVQTIQTGFAHTAGLFYGSDAGNAVAAQYFNQAMNNSVSGQTLAAGGSLGQAKLAAGILGATAAAELSVFGGEGLLAAYGEGSLGAGNVGLTNYLAASTTMNAGISASINIAAQELSTGTIDSRELGFSAALGGLAGYGSGLVGILRNNAEETAAYFLAQYGTDADVSGWQTLNGMLGYLDGLGSPAFEKMLHECLLDMEANSGAKDAGSASINSVNKTSKEGGI
jgi:RHS repeat-associated protein